MRMEHCLRRRSFNFRSVLNSEYIHTALGTRSSSPSDPQRCSRQFSSRSLKISPNHGLRASSSPHVFAKTASCSLRVPTNFVQSCRTITRTALAATAAPTETRAPAPLSHLAQGPPRTGILKILPKSWVPYAELSRWEKPAGMIYLFFPCAFGTLAAAPLNLGTIAPGDVLYTTALFFTGAFIMRGAGCTVNDLWDRNLDPQVERTRLRPIARGAVTPLPALTWAGAQCLAGLGILVQFPSQCLYYGIPSLLLVATYPLAKRVTNYPQVVLGLAFSWGAILGFPAMGVDLLTNSSAMHAAAALYGSCVAWTVLYDMIYAHMDIRDDVKAGIKSIALRHEHNTKAVLTGLAVIQMGLLVTAGMATGAGPAFFIGSCGGAAATLATMIWRVKLKSVSNCWWWFRYGCWFTGGVITAGLGADYYTRRQSLLEEYPTRQKSGR